MPSITHFLYHFFIAVALLFMACESKKPASIPSTPKQQTSALDTARIHTLIRQYKQLGLTPGDTSGARQLRSILKASSAMGYNDKSCELLMDFARFHADRGNFDSTLFYFNQARPYCNKPTFDKTLPAAFLADFGAFYHSLRSDMVSANNSYYQALNYLKAHDLANNSLAIKLYIYLFNTQEELGNPERGLTYLKEAEKLALKLNFLPALISVRTSLGNYYSERKEYATARTYFGLAVADSEQNRNADWHPNIRMAALVGMASVYTKTDEPEKAVPLLKMASEIARDHKIIYSEVVAAIELGEAYNKLGRYKETIPLVTGALDKQGQEFNWYKEEGYRVLMQAYEAQGNFSKALEFQRRLYAFNDSLISKEKTVALHEMEIKYQSAIKDKEIASKKLLIEQQHNKIARIYTLIAGISVAAILAVVILIVLYKNASQRQSIQELEIKTLRGEQEINILRSTMLGEEQERKRISRELHDGIGSMLASAIMRLSMLKKQAPNPAAQKDYDEVLNMLQDTSHEVRKTSHNIMPDLVDKQPLEEAVQGFCQNITQGTAVTIDVQFFGSTNSFSSYCKHTIYRIVQELVHNILKHAQATHAIVQGAVNEETFTLTVEDDGVGFDPAAAKNGIGLQNVESRVKSLHGEYQLESAPGKGTSVYVELSCKHLAQEVPKVS